MLVISRKNGQKIMINDNIVITVVEARNGVCKIAIEADKYSFEMKLKNGLGEQMLEKLTNPDKPSRILKFKIKYHRWRNRQREMKELRLLNKMRKLENIEE